MFDEKQNYESSHITGYREEVAVISLPTNRCHIVCRSREGGNLSINRPICQIVEWIPAFAISLYTNYFPRKHSQA